MAFGGRIDWDEAELARLMSSNGEVGKMLNDAGQRVAQEAKRLAPTSPDGSHGRPSGYLRSQIGFKQGSDASGPYVDVASPARTPSGAPYGLFQEVGTKLGHKFTPHLRPALDILR